MTLPDLMREARALGLPPGQHDFRCTPGAFELFSLEAYRRMGGPPPPGCCRDTLVLQLGPATTILLRPGDPQ